jgi:hypothetical protein
MNLWWKPLICKELDIQLGRTGRAGSPSRRSYGEVVTQARPILRVRSEIYPRHDSAICRGLNESSSHKSQNRRFL